MNKIIYISWITWVWKSTITKQISEKTGIYFVWASNILTKYKADFYINKTSESINRDVDIVLYWLKKEQINNKEILFDWHFVLINNKNEILKIKKDFFIESWISEIILIVDKVENIRERLKKRDNIDYDLDFLEKLQKQEIDYSIEIANILKIKHKIFDISKLWFERTKIDIINYIKILC